MDLKLKDKVVMITGSTGGVGEALVKAFAEEGCKLAISSTKQEKLDNLLKEVKIDPAKLLTFVVDVTKEEQVKNMVEKTVEKFGSLDVQVNNAGYEGLSLPIDNQTMENIMNVYNVNVFGPMFGMKYAIQQMKKQKSGAIVNISSQASCTGAATMSAYVSSKHAALGLSKCAALEVAELGIHINCIGPGPIDTPMMTKLEKQALGENVSKEEAMKIFAASYPNKRYAKPSEVADLALYLASEKSSHITGSLVTMDGGQAALGR
ncbi:NAD(P)-dependent dehydrogenase, short-chain alcohol dehydrogenase family [Lachnospiraceae bacterium YSD2013]|nr:SDR family oxidoreductase [Lachnospiraceae bacterium]SCX20149.1 NAD(P)-dependent dehydrogenase, short-chain alcohol dehydrogenase family [Lachnospiraceae bacterium YSD2013]